MISGVVWKGGPTDAAVLPIIRDHASRNPETVSDGLRRLLAAEQHALPFVAEFRAAEVGTHADYGRLVEEAILLLLGWILPTHGAGARVRILLDRHGGDGAPFGHGFDGTDYYRGLVARNPRYARWDIQEVRWGDTDRELDTYIPYADLLAYLFAGSHRSKPMAEGARIRELSTYVVLTSDLTKRLVALERLAEQRNVHELLDLLQDLDRTPLQRLVMDKARRAIETAPELAERLLAELDWRLRRKGRRIDLIARQMDALERDGLLPPPDDAGPLGVQLLRIVVALQRANHEGRPAAAADAVRRYGALRAEAGEDCPETTTWCDLHLAVHHADRFEFAESLRIAEALR